jgi:hypothetical protein
MKHPLSRFRRWVGFLISGAGLIVLIGDALGQVLR